MLLENGASSNPISLKAGGAYWVMHLRTEQYFRFDLAEWTRTEATI